MKSALPMVIGSAALFALAACEPFIRSPDRDKADEQSEPHGTEIAAQDPPAMIEESPGPAPLERRTVSVQSAEIDWNAARQDMASRGSDAIESFQVQSGSDEPPAVPVLLPTGIVIPQGAENQPRIQSLSDGYFATYPGIAYTIIVNGTNQVIGDRPETGDDEEIEFNYHPTMSGANVSFNRYGADYLVEFECKTLNNGQADCISEEEALDVTEKLVIAGTR